MLFIAPQVFPGSVIGIIDHAFQRTAAVYREQGWREAHQVHPHLQAAVHLMAAVYTTLGRFYYEHTKTIVCFLSDGIQSYVADHVADHLSMKNVSSLDYRLGGTRSSKIWSPPGTTRDHGLRRRRLSTEMSSVAPSGTNGTCVRK